MESQQQTTRILETLQRFMNRNTGTHVHFSDGVSEDAVLRFLDRGGDYNNTVIGMWSCPLSGEIFTVSLQVVNGMLDLVIETATTGHGMTAELQEEYGFSLDTICQLDIILDHQMSDKGLRLHSACGILPTGCVFYIDTSSQDTTLMKMAH
jgi:hypothetical protein